MSDTINPSAEAVINHELKQENRTLRQQLAAALEVLRVLEWSNEARGFQSEEIVWQQCPVCGSEKDVGHATACKLAATLEDR